MEDGFREVITQRKAAGVFHGAVMKGKPEGRLSEQTEGLRASGQHWPETDVRCVVTTETTATSFMCSRSTVAQENSSSKSQQRQSHHRFSKLHS